VIDARGATGDGSRHGPRLPPTPATGRPPDEVERRRVDGLGNTALPPTTRTYVQILPEHEFTLVNNILSALGIALMVVGRPVDALVSLAGISTNVVDAAAGGAHRQSGQGRLAVAHERHRPVVELGADDLAHAAGRAALLVHDLGVHDVLVEVVATFGTLARDPAELLGAVLVAHRHTQHVCPGVALALGRELGADRSAAQAKRRHALGRKRDEIPQDRGVGVEDVGAQALQDLEDPIGLGGRGDERHRIEARHPEQRVLGGVDVRLAVPERTVVTTRPAEHALAGHEVRPQPVGAVRDRHHRSRRTRRHGQDAGPQVRALGDRAFRVPVTDRDLVHQWQSGECARSAMPSGSTPAAA
jgi:hypothetical protein